MSRCAGKTLITHLLSGVGAAFLLLSACKKENAEKPHPVAVVVEADAGPRLAPVSSAPIVVSFEVDSLPPPSNGPRTLFAVVPELGVRVPLQQFSDPDLCLSATEPERVEPERVEVVCSSFSKVTLETSHMSSEMSHVQFDGKLCRPNCVRLSIPDNRPVVLDPEVKGQEDLRSCLSAQTLPSELDFRMAIEPDPEGNKRFVAGIPQLNIKRGLSWFAGTLACWSIVGKLSMNVHCSAKYAWVDYHFEVRNGVLAMSSSSKSEGMKPGAHTSGAVRLPCGAKIHWHPYRFWPQGSTQDECLLRCSVQNECEQRCVTQFGDDYGGVGVSSRECTAKCYKRLQACLKPCYYR